MAQLKVYLICSCLMISLKVVSAQNQCTDLKKACERYEFCLKTGHCEVITSTIIHLMKMHYQYPDHDYNHLVLVLDSVATALNDKPVCTKVLLAKQYLSGEKDLDWMMKFSYEEVYNFLSVWCAAGFDGTAFDRLPVLKNELPVAF